MSLSLSERQQVRLLLRATKPMEAFDLDDRSHISENLLRHSSAVNAIVTPEEYLSWTGAKRRAWDRRFSLPSSFFYHYLHPSFLRHTGPWTSAEHTLFVAALQRFPHRDNWAAFSLLVPGRVGTECRRYYQSIIRAGFVTPTGVVRKLLSSRASVTLESARKGRPVKKIVSDNPLFLRRILKKFTPSILPNVDDSLLLPVCKKQGNRDIDSNGEKPLVLYTSAAITALEKEFKETLMPNKDRKRKIRDKMDKQIPSNDSHVSGKNSSCRTGKNHKALKDAVSRTNEDSTSCSELAPTYSNEISPKGKVPCALDDSHVKIPRLSEVKDCASVEKQVPAPQLEHPTKVTTISKNPQDRKPENDLEKHQKFLSRDQRDREIELRFKRKADHRRQLNEETTKRKKMALLQSIKALAPEPEEYPLHNPEKFECSQFVHQDNGRTVSTAKYLSSTMRKSRDGKKSGGFKLKRNPGQTNSLAGKSQGTFPNRFSNTGSSLEKIPRQNRNGLSRVVPQGKCAPDPPSRRDTEKYEDKSSVISVDPNIPRLHAQAQDERCNSVDQPKSDISLSKSIEDPPKKIRYCENNNITSSSSRGLRPREISSETSKTDDTAPYHQMFDSSAGDDIDESTVQLIPGSVSNDCDRHTKKPCKSHHNKASGKSWLEHHQNTNSSEHVSGVSDRFDATLHEKTFEPIVRQSWSMRKRCQARPPLSENDDHSPRNPPSLERNVKARSIELEPYSPVQVVRHYQSSPGRTSSEDSELSFGGSDGGISFGISNDTGSERTSLENWDGIELHSKEERFATQSQLSSHKPSTEQSVSSWDNEKRKHVSTEAVQKHNAQLSVALRERMYITREMFRMFVDDIDPVSVELGHGCQRVLLLRDFDAHYQRIESCSHPDRDVNLACESLLDRFMDRFKEIEAMQQQHLITMRRTNFILLGK